MREQQPIHYFGIDIGTQTIRCVVGIRDQAEAEQLSVIGHGTARNQGMRKGVIVHVDDVVEAIHKAVAEAEQVSGVDIDHATINISGSNVQGMNSKGVIAISTANKEISNDDRLRVEEAATIMQLPANREIIQVFAKNYRLDGQDNIKNPVGMQGVRLEVDTHIVTVSAPNIKNLESVMESVKINPAHFTVSGLAAAEAVLTRQQKESGTLVLDIGAGTINMVVIEDGEVQHVAVLPVGGINITNDLAIGLKTDLDIAEKVKIDHVSLVNDGKTRKDAVVKHSGKTHAFSADDIRMITEARVEEMMELVDKELKSIHRSRKLPGGVVLVGGTAKMPGIAELAKEKLQLAARVGALQPLGGLVDAVQDPSFFTAVGLMQLDMLLEPISGSVGGEPNDGAFRFIDGLLRRFRVKK